MSLIIRGLIDKIIRERPPQNCATCGDPVDGLYCRPCAFVRKCLNEGWYTIHDENEILNTSESSNDDTNVVSAPQEPFVFNQDPGKNSSQSPPHIDHHCCYECGDSLDDIFCQRCTCKSCGKGAHYGYNCPPQIPIISNPEPCYNQNLNEILQNLQSLQQQCLFGTCQQCGCNEYDGVCFYCTVGNGTPINFSTPYSSNDSPSFANHPPQNFQSFQQQYLCCENCGGPHETYQCQPMNEDYYHEQNSCYDPNSFGFDQFQPPQYTVNHPIFNAQNTLLNAQNELLNSQNKLMEQMTSICDMAGQIMQKKEEEKRIAEEQAAKDRYRKIPICYDDDDDEESSIPLKDIITSGLPPCVAVTPVLLTEEPVDSLIMEDEHLDTIPATESDEVIKSSVEELVPIPSESEGISDGVCDVPLCDNPTPLEAFKDHSEIVVDSNDDSSSSDDDSFSSKDIDKRRVSAVTDYSCDNFLNMITFNTDLSIDSFPLTDRSDFYHEEFAEIKLAHIISPPEYDCFYIKSEPDPGDRLVLLNFGETRTVLLSMTNVDLPFQDDQSPIMHMLYGLLPFLT
ncbi:hypothetical protein Tco_0669917 [Tanacetum coccineum]